METVSELQKRGRVRGTLLTLDKMLNPIAEDCVGETGFEFPGGDKEIIERVVRGANADEEESEDEEDQPSVGDVTKPSEALEICTRMERLCLEYASSDVSVVDLQSQVRKIRAHFRRLDDLSRVQTSLDQFWTKSPTNNNISMS